ncbi:MAG TPA: hypothetical protein VMB35_05695 [Methanomicrobiales archaeon]|nr:hypothetical protein [Methanomicrobiales archaeon]
MIVVLAIDALELALVEAFQPVHLMQKFHGRTDISEFSLPRTMVLWSSFMTGANKEKVVLADGDKEMWNYRFDPEETLFSAFRDPVVIDLPGFSYDLAQHEEERRLLKAFFEAGDDGKKEEVRKAYNDHAFRHHREIKKKFQDAVAGDHDFVLGYFSIADVIGHLNFGNRMLMRMIYRDLDEIAASVKVPKIILSDHGMQAIGIFGDHSGYGFWSSGTADLGTPRITDFRRIIEGMQKG